MQTRRDFAKRLSAGLGAASLMGGCAAKLKGDPEGRKVIVLGLDGLSPRIIREMIDAGRAPNFKKLADSGAFLPLGTTMPALSPVAWSSFITGMSPGGHGIPDFVARDPLTYTPFFAIWEPRDVTRSITLGSYEIPLAGGMPENLRQGKPFWAYLTENGIPATIIKIPTNFPVEQTATRALSGMGTPDVVDSFGVFSYYTSDLNENPDMGTNELIRLSVRNHRASTVIKGPANTLDRNAGGEKTTVPMEIYVDPEQPVARFDVGGKTFVLKEGEFSDWVPVRFELIPWAASVLGNTRILLKQVRPHLQVYVQPINIDPTEQAAPVTYPAEVGGEIASQIGPYWTQGLPANTRAFDAEVFKDEHYVTQAELILKDRMRLFEHEWSRFQSQSSGLFYFYVSSTDQDTHMLWRNMDETHPMHDRADPRFAGYIHDLYARMDEVVGEVLPAVDDKTLLIVCSDHGFESFGRQFHLNTWLRDNGYLTLKDEAKSKETTSFLDVDWEKTAAYGVGFNGLYLNMVGREERGIVSPDKASEMVARISRELEAIRDPDNADTRPVHKVYARDDVYTGDMVFDMPEMLVGCTPGYRVSSASVMLETGKEIVDVNPWAWGGDHSMATELVPGTLFISRAVRSASPQITDLPVTILDFFGFEKPEQMIGRSLFA